MRSSSRQATSPPAQTADSLPTLIDFMYSVPSPVTKTLIDFSPYISFIRRTLEITSWRSHWTESWLALAAWWAVCAFAYPGLKYFLPILLVSAIVFIRWKPPSFLRSSPLITEKNLQHIISDLITIHALIPPLLSPLLTAIPHPILLRIAILIYPPYLLLTYFIPFHILIGVSGTILLTCRAPWSQTARIILWDSAIIRWCFYHLSSFLTGHPLPPKTLYIQTNPTASDGITNVVRFLFMIYENQRWWAVGNWTTSLLPTERPLWCTASRTAVCVPDALSLPAPVVSYLPAPTTGDAKGENGKTGQMIKRTARWSWGEDEWRVMVRKDGNSLVSRVERPLPNGDKDSSGQTSGSARWPFNGVMRRRTQSGDSAAWEQPEEDEEELFEGDDDDDGLIVTDLDGWVYGDNKWQGGGPKNGMGKFTRYRRWTRIAVLTETSEIVDASDYGVAQANIDTFSTQSRVSTGLSLASSTGSQYENGSVPPSPASSTRSRSRSRSRGRLSQRLRAVVDRSGSQHR
ncbi:hypothetical protein PILCRDRAFT_828354 [Piloderma croceum F 1598]|uniref:TECPR1-like DysF domain-containing protein n=1 Tax=Piloderma croceum (strain F 1598) TaxID=765440 RepID=A0A0C3F353_PILCF|nr:hypothetical protein PILCRDRAFT_828354 [Piloderma croceum F 1598]